MLTYGDNWIWEAGLRLDSDRPKLARQQQGLQGTQSPEELEDDVLLTSGILQPSHSAGMRMRSKHAETCDFLERKDGFAPWIEKVAYGKLLEPTKYGDQHFNSLQHLSRQCY